MNPPIIQSEVFDKNAADRVIHVPSGSRDLYIRAENWSAYSSSIKGDIVNGDIQQLNEIWYTTSDENALGFEGFNFGDATVVEDIYENGKGILRCSEPITIVGKHSFYDCDNLISIQLPDNITTIESDAFNNCGNLVSIVLPRKLSLIKEYNFYYCPNLTTVVSKATDVPSLKPNTFYSISLQCVLKVPEGSLEVYKNSDWVQYFSKIVIIED